MGYLTKAMTSYLPSPVSDVLAQDRAFASVQLGQPGLRYHCVITKLGKEVKVLAACEDGFLYIYDLNESNGGECKLVRAHDLRSPLDDITGKHMINNYVLKKLITHVCIQSCRNEFGRQKL